MHAVGGSALQADRALRLTVRGAPHGAALAGRADVAGAHLEASKGFQQACLSLMRLCRYFTRAILSVRCTLRCVLGYRPRHLLYSSDVYYDHTGLKLRDSFCLARAAV